MATLIIIMVPVVLIHVYTRPGRPRLKALPNNQSHVHVHVYTDTVLMCNWQGTVKPHSGVVM